MKIILGLIFSTSLCFAGSVENLEKAISDRNEGLHTDAVLIIRDGKILFETYRRGYDSSKKHLSWSMAKTVAGVLVAQQIDKGRLSLSAPISTYLPELKTTASVKDVFQMSSGISFREEYVGVPVTSDATKMLYLDGPQKGFLSYVSSLPLREATRPGEHFYYSSGDTNLLMAAVKKVMPNQAEYNELPFKDFFTQLGINNATFEQDSSGTFVGSSYIYLTLREFAKVGELLMNQGIMNGVRIIPEWFMKLMNEVAPGVQQSALPGTSQTRAYSMQVTTNKPITGRNLPSEYPDLPSDSLIMIGFQGQFVVASPSQKLIIVRLAMDKGYSLDRPVFFKAVRDVVEEFSGPLVTARDEHPEMYKDHNPISMAKVKSGPHILAYFRIPHLIRALAAKEYCSCIHVVKRSEKYCKEDLKVSLPILPKIRLQADGSVTTVLGTGMAGKKAIALYRGEKLGCTLTTSE